MMIQTMWVKVHIGVVFKIKVNSNDIEVRETDTLKIQWLEKSVLII